MKTKWINKKTAYSGEELRSLYAYLEHGVLGDSVIAFRGPCEVSFKHMVDGEDLLEKSEIRGSDMVHFIFELFDKPLFSGVLLQRLFASIVIDTLQSLSKADLDLHRSGDDIYWKKKKLSISIATRSPNSTMIHFAVNVSNAGTPVATCCLKDFAIDPMKFALACMQAVAAEHSSIVEATCKVRSVN